MLAHVLTSQVLSLFYKWELEWDKHQKHEKETFFSLFLVFVGGVVISQVGSVENIY